MRESSSNLLPSNSQKLNKIQGGDKTVMKKSLSLILAFAMVFTMFASVAFAADTTPAATTDATTTAAATPAPTAAPLTPQEAFDALKAAGIVEGDTVKGANLDANMTRAQFAKVIAKLWSLPEDSEGSTVYSDLAGAGWAAGYIGAATKAGLLNGMGGGKFNPSGNVKLEEIAKVIATGFKLTAVDYAGTGKVSTWAKGFVGAVITAKLVEDSADFTKAAKRSELFTIGLKGYEAIQLAKPTPVPASTGLDVSSAAALNSKVIEVSLGTAAVAADLTVANASVKDAAGVVNVVTSVVAAPYATDGKTVLVTLTTDTVAGTLYTLTSGTKTANFGGKAVDTAKPEVTKVEGTDAYEVTVTFSEPVKLDGATFVLAEKYNSKTALPVKSFKYSDSSTIVITTDNQKDATLYGAEISAIADFAGNTMDKSTDQTFNGHAASTADVKVIAAGSNNPDEAVVQFDVNLDPATLVAANFKVEEAYSTKAVLPVTAARIATKDDLGVLSTTVLTASDAKKYAIISVTGLKTATLYKVTVTNVKTLYGKGQDSSANNTTFTGTPVPTEPFTYTVNNNGAAASNTSVVITFINKVVKADAENVANYSLIEAYNTKSTIAVTKAVLDGNGKKLTLTVGKLSTVLYKLTVSNVKDIYTNAIKTADSANVTTVSGVAIADKISAIDSIVYLTDTTILVTFNQSVGANATDVSLYNIDTNVGYPNKASTTDLTSKQVKLTIPKLNAGDTYKLTVKGLYNADGVAMDSAGITSSFVGQGTAAGLPKLTGVFATDNQTLKLYFDRDVTKDSIKGPIYTNNTLVSGALTYTKVLNSVTTTTNLDGLAYQDPSEKNALVIRVDTDDAFKTGSFTINGLTGLFHADNKTLGLSPKTDEPTAILVENVQALNKWTLRVYFNQPVYGGTSGINGFASVKVTNGTVVQAPLSLQNGTAIDATNKVYDFKLSSAQVTANTKLELLVATSLKNSPIISDDLRTTGHVGYVGTKDETTGVGSVDQIRVISINTADAPDLKDVSVIALDNKTIKVYYPTLMNHVAFGDPAFATSVLNPANYSFVNGDAAPAPTLITTAGLVLLKYSTDDNSVIITLNATLSASTNGSYLLFTNTHVSNAVATQEVKDVAAVIKKQLSPNPAASAKVTVTSATYAGGTITVKFNQLTKTADISNVISVLDITYKKLVDGVITDVVITNTANIFSVTAKNGDYTITGTGLTSGAFDAAEYFDSVVIKLDSSFNGVLVAGQTGKVQVKAGLTGINENLSDTDSTTTFAQN
ncbi:MAG: S-layer homology domain-containing protein [Paenibacillaceae bacterium]